MTNATTRLDVFLRGQRTYVQGSQILGRCGEWLQQLGHADSALQSAKFTAITTCSVMAAIGASPPERSDGLNAIGVARYRTASGVLPVSFFEMALTPAPRIPDGTSRLSALDDRGGLNGESWFTTQGRHEDYLAAVVETVKALHNSLGTRVADIWFTAIANADLPVAAGAPLAGQFKISPLVARNLDNRRQTLSRVETVSAAGAGPIIAPFNIAFSCLIEEV